MGRRDAGMDASSLDAQSHATGSGGVPGRQTGDAAADARSRGSGGIEAGTSGGGGSSAGGAGVSHAVRALFIMLDRSSSMVQGTGTGGSSGSPNWDNVAAGFVTFVQDSRSRGVDIGLGTFPVGANNTSDCAAGTDCGTPVVPIASLPGNSGNLIDAMTSQRPALFATTPTECALHGMINTCLQFHATSATGEQCVGVLVTDGVATVCDTNETDLTAIIAEGHSKGVETYTLGLSGASIDVLNQYAQAGGTGSAIDVSGGADAFSRALLSIASRP